MDHSESSAKANQSESRFGAPLNLPKTNFPFRPEAAVTDLKLLERWQREDVFNRSRTLNKGKQQFFLHDGPPYANGPIHLGHAYNKISKDIIAKAQRMEGKHVPVVPGWDCHGLPIELKVASQKQGLTPVEFISACRAYATEWIDAQRESFKKLGVLMDWEHPYITMDPEYEAGILRAFARFVKAGFVQKKLKTVPWCPTDQTVLATAEIEYANRKDPSIYVLFQASDSLAQKCNVPVGACLYYVIWTTTPWTLPLNRAVLYKPLTEYAVLKRSDGSYYVVAQQLSASFSNLFEQSLEVHAVLSSELFQKEVAKHPFIDALTVPLLPDPSISLDDGTALVHCAPGCGPQDYDIGVRHGLEIYSPLTADGKYSSEITPSFLAGVSVSDGQGRVIQLLSESGHLAYKTSLVHSYPHCWRCHNGLIFRATSQWFCSLTHNDLKRTALSAIDSINFYPSRSSHFLKAAIENRVEWCLSRQRVWGVPIPALLCNDCNFAYISEELIERVAQEVSKQGIEYWHSATVSDLMPSGVVCPNCGPSAQFKKEMDILDVWFDSGVSHAVVQSLEPELLFPADLYVEGVDQHRGWFQSSLLTSMAIDGNPATRGFLTHGFTVDEKGHKMSKSIGNVVSPDDIIKQLGTDGLRLWVASIDYRDDAIVSSSLLQNVAQVYRKVRNTCRFLLSNLYDFNFATDAVSLDQLSLLDKYILSSLSLYNERVRSAYAAYDLTAVFHALADYCSIDLSSLYCDVIKDRLYVLRADDKVRRSAQTVCWYVLDVLTRLMAPILSFTSELIADEYQSTERDSIHLQQFNHLHEVVLSLRGVDSAEIAQDLLYPYIPRVDRSLQPSVALAAWDAEWAFLLDVRSALLKVIEGQRALGLIKHSLEVSLAVSFAFQDEQHTAFFQSFTSRLGSQSLAAFFKEILIVSEFKVSAPSPSLALTSLVGLSATASRVEGVKCPRCWHYVPQLVEQVCDRCAAVAIVE